MQIVIELADEIYEMKKSGIIEENINEIISAVIFGKPLPKGHGRLIDADNMKRIDAIQRGDFNSIESISAWIDIMPTVIEADREESEDKYEDSN